MIAPLIGITGRRMVAGQDWVAAMQGESLDVHISAYSSAIARAGGSPVQLTREGAAAEVASRVDGVLLTGGEDVSPDLYGAMPDPGASIHDRDRDEYELDLFAAVRAAGLPVLGICRGAQLINVALGGTLVGHLEGPSATMHTAWERPHAEHRHPVVTAAGSAVRGLIGDRALVNSLHHQAIDNPAPGTSVTAAAPDGTPEAIESDDGTVLGVQWHPELHHDHDAVFGWLVRQAMKRTALSLVQEKG